MNQAWIGTLARTPVARAGRRGAFAGVRPVDLLHSVLNALRERFPEVPEQAGDLLLGCVDAVGEQGANLARIGVLYAGWPERLPGMTVSRFCPSGLEAVNLAAARIRSGQDELLVAGGVESLSRVPLFSDRGAWFADPDVAARTRFLHMGVAADLLAAREGIPRETLDAWALRSHRLAGTARGGDAHFPSVVPVNDGDGTQLLAMDDAWRANPDPEDFAAAEPAFDGPDFAAARKLAGRESGLATVPALHHAGTAPALADAAALAVLGSREGLSRCGLPARARVVDCAVAAADPVIMLTAHVDATRRLLARNGLAPADIDVFEINESFAASVIHYQQALDIDPDRINNRGGAIAIGHPLGATGAVLLANAVERLEAEDRNLALVAIPGGAGVGVATLVSREGS